MDRRGRTGQVINLIHFHVQGKRHVVAYEFELGIVHQVIYIFLVPGETIVHADNLVSILQKPLTQMRPKKAGSTGNQYGFRADSSHIYPQIRYWFSSALCRPSGEYLYFLASGIKLQSA